MGGQQHLILYLVPRMKDETIEFNEVVENDEEELNETQEKVKEANEEKPETGPEEEKILRLRLTRLSDDGYQTFGMNGSIRSKWKFIICLSNS